MSVPAGILEACGVLVGLGPDGQFAHLATAWSLGEGDWVAAWASPEAPVAVRLLRPDGAVGPVTDWECEDGIAGFISEPATVSLAVAGATALHKHDPLYAVGFPSVVDHPAFALHHGSLDPERYLPYLCPWVVEGHLVLFSSQDGWMPGRFYAGMNGGPVVASGGTVVGILLDGAGGGAQPPLCRFRRLDRPQA